MSQNEDDRKISSVCRRVHYSGTYYKPMYWLPKLEGTVDMLCSTSLRQFDLESPSRHGTENGLGRRGCSVIWNVRTVALHHTKRTYCTHVRVLIYVT